MKGQLLENLRFSNIVIIIYLIGQLHGCLSSEHIINSPPYLMSIDLEFLVLLVFGSKNQYPALLFYLHYMKIISDGFGSLVRHRNGTIVKTCKMKVLVCRQYIKPRSWMQTLCEHHPF